MEINNIKALEAKYWEGSTSLEEERLLFGLSIDDQAHLSEDARDLIEMKSGMASMKLGLDFENSFWAIVEEEPKPTAKIIPMFGANFFAKYAAVGIVLVTIGFSITDFISEKESQNSLVATDTYMTPEEAFAETKRALLFASNKLNKGKNHLNELSRFDNSMQAAEAVIK